MAPGGGSPSDGYVDVYGCEVKDEQTRINYGVASLSLIGKPGH